MRVQQRDGLIKTEMKAGRFLGKWFKELGISECFYSLFLNTDYIFKGFSVSFVYMMMCQVNVNLQRFMQHNILPTHRKSFQNLNALIVILRWSLKQSVQNMSERECL